ncbi:putative Regulatory protein TetR [Nostocoides japonicum T1-X7]|uniref:Putative Regulatory protein TetR n=1 Tax=Nostocoides japonicum T1-X7 TaxID=1194083 RepID=A0A077M065_9MICO|nr:TetR/AcrR family transcriptional regulator [Tetrasphaera japonica]CCH79643.1 putative Regulatory protein TetR [Tetrasphaera japonica T1-X7]
MTDVKKRRYHSPLRAEQAQASRAAVLRAAHELFVAQGYGSTTIEEVAERAGVSKPTVFTAVGNKATLLKVVRDVTMAGDDEPRTVTDREDVAAIAAAGDLDRAVALTARHITAVNARYHDVHEVIRGASGSDPAVAELWRTAEAERHVGAGHLLARLGAKPIPTRRRAQDQLWLLMAPDTYHRLVVCRGWSRPAYERWITGQIRALFA